MIKQYIAKNGDKLYLVDVRKKSKKDQSIRVQKRMTRIKTLQEAQKVEREITTEVVRELIRREESGASWRALIDRYAVAAHEGEIDRAIQKWTVRDTIRTLELYTASWMKKPAVEISPQDVKDALREMQADGKSKSRCKALKSAINVIFDFAIERRLAPGAATSPARGVKVGRVEEKKPDILTLAEIRTLIREAERLNHEWFPVWMTALHTGMRSMELFTLKWTDVDFENRLLHVVRSWHIRDKREKSTKGGYWRDVPINPELEILLKELRAKTGGRGYVLPRLPEWPRNEAARVLRQFCTGIGITPVKFHALRACFATQLLRDKVAPAVVMKICGWKDLKVMQRYIRLAGIEIEHATDSLRLLSPKETMDNVVKLFRPDAG